MARFLPISLIAFVLVMHFGCRHSGRTDVADDLIRVLLDGFVFGGTEAQVSAAEFAGGPPRRERPAQFELGQAHVFYLPRNAADIGAWTSTRDRLRKVGAEIVSGPKPGSDVMQLTTGGPMFEFSFRYRGRSGFIHNELDPRIMRDESLSRLWLLEKYIVRLDS